MKRDKRKQTSEFKEAIAALAASTGLHKSTIEDLMTSGWIYHDRLYNQRTFTQGEPYATRP